MTVKEAFKNLNKLITDGHGNLELIFIDVRSGDSGSVNIYDSFNTVTGEEDMGKLCEKLSGQRYVPIYCDH